MRYIRKHLLPISIVASGILISIPIWYRFDLDALQKIFSIVGSFSLGVALVTYFTKKKYDETLAAIEQITFFREKIIPEWSKVINKIRLKNKKYIFSQIRLDKPTIEFMREKYPINFQEQTAIFLNDLSNLKYDTVVLDSETLDSQILLFNMLEEFSLRVRHFETDQHEALNSVRAAFVKIIEMNAAVLIFERDVQAGNQIYSTTLSLYNSWKDSVSRIRLIDGLEKYRFITKEQKEEVIKQSKEIRRSVMTKTSRGSSGKTL